MSRIFVTLVHSPYFRHTREMALFKLKSEYEPAGDPAANFCFVERNIHIPLFSNSMSFSIVYNPGASQRKEEAKVAARAGLISNVAYE